MLTILEYPNPKLREKGALISVFDEELKSRSEQMIDTMRDAQGVGLAAIQVGWALQMLVMECDGSPINDVMVICNPEILESKGVSPLKEGCLSVPGIHESLARADWVRAKWQDATGETKEGVFEGLAAVCLQHEMDHLSGLIFFEKLSALKASRAREKFFKEKKKTTRA